MKKNVSQITTILCFLIKMVIFCTLWLLFFRKPFISNLLYSIALFVGCEILIYCTNKLINKIKK